MIKSKSKALDKLLQVLQIDVAIENYIENLKSSWETAIKPYVSAEYWNVLIKKIQSIDYLERAKPIYGKHLTLADINVIIDFYTSPVGMKFAGLNGSKEFYEASKVWAEEILKEIEVEMAHDSLKQYLQ